MGVCGGVIGDVPEDKSRRHVADDTIRQAQKMEAVGQLTGGIAHDFNNLLQGIAGSLELLQARIAEGRLTDAARYADVAMTEVQRAAMLTHRLLTFARRQSPDPKSIVVNRVVAGMEDLVRRTVGPSIEVVVVPSANVWPTWCDANQLENALLNLVINARDAMADGGRLTIETANAHLDDAYVRSQTEELIAGQYVSISVMDSGAGMSETVAKRAFEPFFTTKPMGQGTGLGLSMVHGFIRQSNGHARIHTEEGRGTTVRIYLPRDRGSAAGPDEISEAGSEAAGQSQLVLVVEDEPAVRMLLAEMLQGLGYRVLEAQNGPDALRILHSAARMDLLVTDVGLPGMNGLNLANAARERRPGLKVLFITGYAPNATVGEDAAMEPGMALIRKPFALATLATQVAEMIGATR